VALVESALERLVVGDDENFSLIQAAHLVQFLQARHKVVSFPEVGGLPSEVGRMEPSLVV
jgi:hypothetical protein